MKIAPVIFGISTLKLTSDEIRLFTEVQPIGFIIFSRNIEDKIQLRQLTDSMKKICKGYNPLILVDQEGGRVARLREPNWQNFPAAKYYADMADEDIELAVTQAYEGSAKIADDLKQVGINVNCAPMCDILYSTSHNIIGDRAYGKNAQQVATLARAVANGLLDNNILPIIKHIPGHGRALVDSHENLPIIDASIDELQNDFEPFKLLSDLPLAMTAHIIYQNIDADNPATLSPKVINVIRTEIGFNGIILTDDLCMKALKDILPIEQLAIQSLEAGCDIVLHCNGDFSEIEKISNILQKNNLLFDANKLDILVV